jgi:hypothetical protein
LLRPAFGVHDGRSLGLEGLQPATAFLNRPVAIGRQSGRLEAARIVEGGLLESPPAKGGFKGIEILQLVAAGIKPNTFAMPGQSDIA